MPAILSAVTAAVLLVGTTSGYTVDAQGRFAPPAAFIPSAAVTYDQSYVPAAASIRVRQHTSAGGATTIDLRIAGVRPRHSFGASVHQRPCGTLPVDAGPRYENQPGAADDNEVRLDFTTDAQGTGGASDRHTWGLRRDEAASVVIQDRPGEGATRVACFTVPFGWVTE
ncbi:superoxide dismutase family protein [Streptomyces sp. NBC_01171]|uniref:superoxide dismutase family protein n=1 Tax=Streptomyces sp. NBC_01171 TaxID=2903757 RepID=UPI00387051CB|nr:superoxide dismutase family protein [Streptomyces sp. NBC_01171]